MRRKSRKRQSDSRREVGLGENGRPAGWGGVGGGLGGGRGGLVGHEGGGMVP